VATARVRKLSRDCTASAFHRTCGTKVDGSRRRPRLCVYRSLGHIYAQVIDDRSGKTLVSAARSTANRKKNLKGGGQHRGRKSDWQNDRPAREGCWSQQGSVSTAADQVSHGRVKALGRCGAGSGYSFKAYVEANLRDSLAVTGLWM